MHLLEAENRLKGGQAAGRSGWEGGIIPQKNFWEGIALRIALARSSSKLEKRGPSREPGGTGKGKR